MKAAFGEAVGRLEKVQVEQESPYSPAEDMARVKHLLAGLQQGGAATLRFYRPQPTAAFAPRDTTHAHYESVSAALQARGFAPAERGAGGQLAVYDQAALVIDLVAPHPEPRQHTRERFRLFAETIAAAFRSTGIDARIGAVAGEYCPGDYSVNAGGRIKLAGLAQRVVRHGFHMGAVLSVTRSDAAREAVTEAYAAFGIPFDPDTFGALTDLMPGLATAEASAIIALKVSEGLGIASLVGLAR